MQKRADKTVQILISVIVVYAILLFVITRNLTLTATVLAVTCPCAWALATPTAFASVIGWLAKERMLARGGEPLELINDVAFVVLDKTGTVTLAEPEIKEIIALKLPEKELLEIAASIESWFNHPIANSISHYAKAQGTPLKTVNKAEDIPGRGVKAIVEGKEVVIGAPDTLKSIGIELPTVKYKGRAIWVAVNKEPVGIFIIQDIMRAHAVNLASKIRSFGIKKVILATGDNEESEAKRVAEIVGVDEYYYSYKPKDKMKLIRTLQSEGRVIMVGDGVNDAPALAAADVGIAIGGYTNINLAIKSSDIVILSSDAVNLLKVLKLSRRMKSVLKQDYRWAFTFNGIGLFLATLGVLNPVIAAVYTTSVPFLWSSTQHGFISKIRFFEVLVQILKYS